MAKKPPSKYEAERLAFFKKTRRSLKQFDIDPTEGSGWTTTIGMSTPFPAEEETVESETPPAVEPPKLPPPEISSTITQSTRGDLATSRPDKHPEYWGAGPTQSTCVWEMQWVPTRFEERDISEAIPGFNDVHYKTVTNEHGISHTVPEHGSFFNSFSEPATIEQVVGDLIVAFARPSKSQQSGFGALYVYSGITQNQWTLLLHSSTLGKSINQLGTGKLFEPSMAEAYKTIHTEEDYWIFNESWATGRIGIVSPDGKHKDVSHTYGKKTKTEKGAVVKTGKGDIFK
jgi:hypothetical protein